MPFEKYLEPQARPARRPHSSYAHPEDEHALATPVQIQLPPCIIGGPPILAQGGGAEVLPTAALNDAWFSNNGFVRYDTPSYPGPSHISDEQGNIPQPMFAYASSPLDLVRPGIFSNKQFNSSSYPDSSSSTPPSAELASAANNFPQSFGVLDASPTLGLPIYSATGFDLLSLLARVHSRPNQQITLGPVDLSCSFVVVDVRRHDRPIVFCSPTFCRLTGYTEAEIIGRNCRFLQAPGGAVVKGEPRKYTSNDEVSRMRKALHADKECQVRLVNFRKDGTAFMNLVTVIPLHGGEHGLAHEENEVYYHIGFQVDLNLQPHAMMERFKDGTYHASPGPPPATTHREKKNQSAPLVLSKSLRVMLNDPAFIASLSPASSLTALQTDKSEPSPEPGQLFNTLLLSAIPDFIHVVSLKGLFLYVAPAVRKVLGYEPEELIGKSITDYCHPHDIVPLTRELKESSATSGQMHDAHVAHPSRPRTVDLLFRGLTKSGSYVWVECRGRLYVEPGKGRKAIILSGRARSMASLPWSDVPLGGGLNTSIRNTRAVVKPDDESVQVEVKETEREFWGSLSEDGVVLVAGQGVSAVMGWSGEEILGHSLVGYLAPGEDSAMNSLLEVLRGIHEGTISKDPQHLCCKIRRKDGSIASTHLVLYQSREDSQQGAQPKTSESSTSSSSLVSPPSILPVPRAVLPAPVMFQLKTIDNLPCNHQAVGTLCHDSSTDVFEELHPSRETSWQYELQQLKIRNQALAEEVGWLEAQQLQAERQPQTQVRSQPQAVPSQQPQQPTSHPAYHQQFQQPQQPPRPHHKEPYDTGGGTRYPNDVYSLKRSWDSVQ